MHAMIAHFIILTMIMAMAIVCVHRITIFSHVRLENILINYISCYLFVVAAFFDVLGGGRLCIEQ